ncbi:M14 family metallopeptidase [Vibrio litoralis]|uniref:M14 family metallopeptidase n=1 Tax=Vibrio litoralis TaxID=335972 RepID=UPI0004817B8F|nr:M14 family metallopeptidase [Vibrio litoralis]
MSNDYFERTNEFSPHTVARGQEVSGEFDAVQTAFEKLPTPRLDGESKGFTSPFTILTPTEDQHPATNLQLKVEKGRNNEQDARLDNLENFVGGVGDFSERYATLRYLATEGQTTIIVPAQFESIAYIHKNGLRKYQTVDFTYDRDTRIITFTDALVEDDEILVDVGLVPDALLLDLLALQQNVAENTQITLTARQDVEQRQQDIIERQNDVTQKQQQVSQDTQTTVDAKNVTLEAKQETVEARDETKLIAETFASASRWDTSLGLWAVGKEVSSVNQLLEFDDCMYAASSSNTFPLVIDGATPTDDSHEWFLKFDDSDLHHVAIANNVGYAEVSYLQTGTLSGVSYFFDVNTQNTYFAKIPVTGDVTNIVEVTDNDATITVDGNDINLERVIEFRYVSGGYVYWDTPEMDNMRTDLPDPIFNGFNYDPMLAYSELWDSLLEKEPDWITKTSLGNDESDTFPIYLYDFKPKQYDKTIIISCNIHGSERLSQYATWFFFRHMLENWKESAQFTYAKNAVRWLVVPNLNPYGYSTNSRGNVNTVNLNRNADYHWDDYYQAGVGHADYKGDAVWSEKEARIMRDLVEAHPEALAYIDFHNFSSTGTRGSFPLYIPGDGANGWDVFGKAIDAMNNGEFGRNNLRIKRGYNPSMYTWCHKNFGMYTANPEFDPGYYGSLFGPECNTACTRYYGNLLLALSQVSCNATQSGKSMPRAGMAAWTKDDPVDGIFVSATDTTIIPEFSVKVPIDTAGYIRINGTITVSGDEALQFIAMPFYGQNYQGKAGYNDPFGDAGYWRITYRTNLNEVFSTVSTLNDRITIPFCATFPVSPTMKIGNDGSSPGTATLGLAARVSNGKATIWRYAMNWDFIPSSLGDETVVVDLATEEDEMVRVVPYY